VFQSLVAALSQFGIRLPADLVILSRALVTLDGTLRTISPGFSMVAAANQIGSGTAVPALDPNEMVRDELASMLPHLRRIPDRLDRILMLTGRGDLRIRTVIDEDSRRILRTLVNRALLVAVGAAFLIVSAGMLLVPDKGPAVASGVGLYEILGYGGLLAGTVLLLRVVAAVARDGTT
jgi:ubiquinone biosynthesis protein